MGRRAARRRGAWRSPGTALTRGVTCCCHRSGFVAKAKPVGDPSYNRRILTAGHCVYVTGGWQDNQNWHNPAGTQTWGDNKAMDFYQYEWPVSCPTTNTICVYNDLGLIGVGSASPSAWNLYYAGGSVEI